MIEEGSGWAARTKGHVKEMEFSGVEGWGENADNCN